MVDKQRELCCVAVIADWQPRASIDRMPCTVCQEKVKSCMNLVYELYVMQQAQCCSHASC
jgi:hypothetical protein